MPPRPPPPSPKSQQKRFSLIGKPNNRYSNPVPILDVQAAYAVTSSHSPSLSTQEFGSPGSADDVTVGPSDYHVKIVCVGDGGCGKTCMMVTYAHGVFPERYVPTVFENYLTKVQAPSGKVVELALWDTAGQEEYDRLRALSYPEVDILLVCFSVDNPMSLDNVYDKWVPEISHHCPGVPFILVGLKTDLRQDLTTIQHLESKGLKPLTVDQAKQVGRRIGAYKYMECSARRLEGLSDIFNTAISVVIKETRNVSSPLGKRQVSRINPAPVGIKSTSHKAPPPKRKKHCIIL
jgi:small GTP-binding protein